MVPSTPLKDKEQRENTVMTIIEAIKGLEVDYVKLYEEGMQNWTKLMQDEALQEIAEKVQSMQDTVQKSQDVVMTMPLEERIPKMMENRQLFVDVNKLKDEQRTIARKLEPQQEEVLQLAQNIGGMQTIVQKIVQESEENLQSTITTQIT